MRQLSDIVYNQGPLMLVQGARVQEACREMHRRRVGSVLVTDENGSLVGIFTGRDAVGRVLAEGRDPAETILAEVMTPNPITMPPHLTAIEALRLMWDGGFRHVPVVDDGKVVGVVSRGDFKGSEHNRMDEERALWETMR
jgi:CBS domain-containing protein